MTALLEAVHTPATVEKLMGIQVSIREVVTSTGDTFSGKVHELDAHIRDYDKHLNSIDLLPKGLFYEQTSDQVINDAREIRSEEVCKATRAGQGEWFVAFYDVGLLLKKESYREMQVMKMLSHFAGVQSRITETLEAWGENDHWHNY